MIKNILRILPSVLEQKQFLEIANESPRRPLVYQNMPNDKKIFLKNIYNFKNHFLLTKMISI